MTDNGWMRKDIRRRLAIVRKKIASLKEREEHLMVLHDSLLVRSNYNSVRFLK